LKNDKRHLLCTKLLKLKAAQQSVGAKIDARCNKNFAGLDAKVESIIKETIKSEHIKKDAILYDPSLIECDITSAGNDRHISSQPSQPSLKRNRQLGRTEYIDVRSPVTGSQNKKQDMRNDARCNSINPSPNFVNNRPKGLLLLIQLLKLSK